MPPSTPSALRLRNRLRSTYLRTSFTAALLLCTLAVSDAGAIEPAPACDFHYQPAIGFTCGNHSFELSLSHRFRTEVWDAFKGTDDTFHLLQTRVGARYSYLDKIILFAEFQDARAYSLDADTSGTGSLYRTWGGNDEQTDGQALRRLFLELRPTDGLSIKAGRQDIKLGLQAPYPEANWQYVKTQRASQRLVGTVGWTNVERSNDGFVMSYDAEKFEAYSFVARPTTGVFDHPDGYHHQQDILYGGLSASAKRGTWLANTEFRGFFIGYGDDRPKRDGGLPKNVEVYTLGGQILGIYPLGPGNFDVLLWGAGQFGRYNGQSQQAGAAIGEIGYQLPEVWSKPWLRFGANYASGGRNDGDTHHTFFNLLPTNHLYYGFADQLALQNLVDIFVQLKLQPHERVGINLMFHQFYLADRNDLQYFGTGAFTKNAGASGVGNFGYGGNPSGGDNDFGREIDVILDVQVYKGVSLLGGYSHIWGGDVIKNLVAAPNNASYNDDKLNFGFIQLLLKY